MSRRFLAGILAILAAIFLCGSLAGAFGSAGLPENFRLENGQTYHGNLTAVARNVDLQAGSRVEGSLAVLALNSVTLGGEIEGNVSVLAPAVDVRLRQGLHIRGDLALCGRSVDSVDGVIIDGQLTTGCDLLNTMLSGAASAEAGFPQFVLPLLFNRYSGGLASRLFQVTVNSLAMAAVAALVALLFPRPLRRIADAATTAPATTGIVGFLTMLAALALTLVYAMLVVVTLGLVCFASPLFAAGWLIIVMASVVGWVAVSGPVGLTVARRLGISSTPIGIAALGAGSLTLLQGVLEMIPCLGWLGALMLVALGSAGFGAVLLTRLGMRSYPEIVKIKHDLA